MVNHMTDAVSKHRFLAADKTHGCETTSSTVLRFENKDNFSASSDEAFISILTFWTFHGHGLMP